MQNRKNVLYFVIKEAPEKFFGQLKNEKRKNFKLNFSKSKNRCRTFSLNCLISSSNALICLLVPSQTTSFKYLARCSFLPILSTNSWDKKWKRHGKNSAKKQLFHVQQKEKFQRVFTHIAQILCAFFPSFQTSKITPEMKKDEKSGVEKLFFIHWNMLKTVKKASPCSTKSRQLKTRTHSNFMLSNFNLCNIWNSNSLKFFHWKSIKFSNIFQIPPTHHAGI